MIKDTFKIISIKQDSLFHNIMHAEFLYQDIQVFLMYDKDSNSLNKGVFTDNIQDTLNIEKILFEIDENEGKIIDFKYDFEAVFLDIIAKKLYFYHSMNGVPKYE